MNTTPLKVKLNQALRIDRAIRFAWKAAPGWMVASAGLVVVQGVLPLLSLYLLKLIIDSVSSLVYPGSVPVDGGDRDAGGVVMYICFAGGVGLAAAVCRYWAEYAKKAQAAAVTDTMLTVLHQKSVTVDLAFYESPKYRDTLHRAQQEGPFRPTNIINGLVTVGQNGASLVAILWLLAVFNPVLLLVMMLAVIPGVVMRLNYSDRFYQWQKNRTEDERKTQYFNWMLTGETHARELRLFGVGKYFIGQFQKIRDVLRAEKLGFDRQKALGELIAQSSVTIAVFGSLVYIAVKTVQGAITIGDMVMYFQAVQRGMGYLGAFVDGVAALYEDNLFLSHFYEFLDIQPAVKDPERPVGVPDNIKSGFKVENVTFRYPHCEKNVIEGLDFDIRPGEVVALVGENGAGKSTLVKLLCRLYDPAAGGLYLDGTDIRNFQAAAYRKRIAVVFQDYIRYYLTVRENIWLGDISGENAEGAIQRAAEKAGINSYVQKMPLGFDTPLGRWYKGGAELSVGQWQMVALARAFFRDADLVILDEPASSLDIRTETRIFQKFRELVENKAALIISHRFSTVKMADKIMLLHDGRIVEQGSHAELVALDGRYAGLYRQQVEQYRV